MKKKNAVIPSYKKCEDQGSSLTRKLYRYQIKSFCWWFTKFLYKNYGTEVYATQLFYRSDDLRMPAIRFHVSWDTEGGFLLCIERGKLTVIDEYEKIPKSIEIKEVATKKEFITKFKKFIKRIQPRH